MQGDEKAFQVLYNHLSDPLFRYILARTKDRDDTFDVMQDVFVDLWKGLQRFSYQSEGQFYGFVFTITKRKLSKHYRLIKKHGDLSYMDHIDDLYEIMPIETKDDLRVTIEATEQLKNKYKEVIELRYWSDLSFADIAKLLGEKETTVKVRHHRAIKQLEEIIKRYET